MWPHRSTSGCVRNEQKSFSSSTVKEKQAVERLKDLSTNLPVHALLWATGLYSVKTVARNISIGCFLQQKLPYGPVKPIRYRPRTLNDMERELAATHRQGFALVCAALLLQSSLQGSRFIVRTDHEALKYLVTMSDPSRKLAYWRPRLSKLELDIVHLASIKHQAADTMSRLMIERTDTTELDDDISPLAVTIGMANTDETKREQEARQN